MTDTEQPRRRPGEWPEEYVRIAAERARWELTLGSIRAHLEEQPSPAAVRAAGRRWINAVLQLTEHTAANLRGQHTKERDQ